MRRDTEGSEILIYFNCDYTEGCHPNILKRLCETNMMQTVGYSEDEICDLARAKIRKACGREDVDVHFLVGGTQTNATVIAAILRPHQGALSADTGHINVHETGAVEHAGHKCETAPAHDGKISADQVRAIAANWAGSIIPEHITQPKMVYLSMATETGSVYTLAELAAIRAVCDEFSLYLFIDGARLSYCLEAIGGDVSLEDIARLADVFYCGGTKCGALFGEAVVIVNDELKPHFRASMKQNGAMLAKGWLLGAQFEALFTDDLYFKVARRANEYAARVKDACAKAGIPLFAQTTTNQIFINFTDAQYAQISERFELEFEQRTDEEHVAIRVCTSWATREEEIVALEEAIAAL